MVITERDKNGIAVLDIEGEIRRSEAGEVMLRRRVKDLIEAGKRKILLNMEKVPFVDSLGVQEIVESWKAAQKAGARFKLAHVSRKLLLILQVTRLDTILDIAPDEDTALRGFAAD